MSNKLQTKNVPFWISISVLGIMFSVISILIYRNMKEMLGGVNIDARIEQAENLNNNLLNLKGNAKHATYVSINGREIFIEKDGDFEEKIVAPDGYSIITLFARNKFGEDEEKIIEIYTKNEDFVVYN